MEHDHEHNGRDRPRPSPSPPSSDDDADALLPNPGSPPKPPRRRRSSFHLDLRGPRPSRRPILLLLLLLVALPALALAAYLLLSRRPSASPSASLLDPSAAPMREAELRALSLLRSQQASLLRIWNRTLAAPPPANLTPSHDDLADLRSALLDQIRLNREVQKVLLSTHHAGNVSAYDNADSLLLGGAPDVCRKVERGTDRRTIQWNPKKDRYLLAICVSGQMSNHLICLEKHMLFAALLGRVLVLPSPKFDYQYDRVIDIDHINECFHEKVVITFDEFTQIRKNKMSVDKFICYMAEPPCYVDEEHSKRLKALGLSLAKLEAAWPKSREKEKRVARDITIKFGCDYEVLAVGDLFYADVEDELVRQPGGPLAHSCKTVIQPSKLITLTAERFVQTFLGGNFIALHFRRHGFLKFCNEKAQSCFYPIPQAAECVLRVIERANAPVIYLSTDAADSETNLLQSFMVLNDKRIPLVKRPGHNPAEKWDALLFRHHLDGDIQVDAMLDKTICALSSVFIGAPGSTFTDDIIRLRNGWGTTSVCDENLCRGEQPNFIASKE